MRLLLVSDPSHKLTVILSLGPVISDAMGVSSLWEVRRRLSVSCFRFLCDFKKGVTSASHGFLCLLFRLKVFLHENLKVCFVEYLEMILVRQMYTCIRSFNRSPLCQGNLILSQAVKDKRP